MMPFSPWDQTVPYNSSYYSNLECFLQTITPSVPTQLLPKEHSWTSNGFWQANGLHYFPLRDFWQSYAEQSVYGAPVPLLLKNDKSVVQYYCPSLSAIQIFTINPFDHCTSFNSEDSQGDTKMLSNNKSSSTSSDNLPSATGSFGYLYFQYNETLRPYERLPLLQKINELAKDHSGLVEFNSAELSPYSWVAIAWYPIYNIPVAKNVKDLSACFLTYHTLSSSFRDTRTQKDEKIECVVSLKEDTGGKKADNGERGDDIECNKLEENDEGEDMKLDEERRGEDNEGKKLRVKERAEDMEVKKSEEEERGEEDIGVKKLEKEGRGEEDMGDKKLEEEEDMGDKKLEEEEDMGEKKLKDVCNGKISIPPFAIATYRVFGKVWMNPKTSDEERIETQETAACFWLRQLRFMHNDYNFFMSRRFYNF